MGNAQVKTDRRYTKDHEWARAEGDEVAVGVSAHAVDQLGDITLVNIDVAEGDTVEVGKAFGTIESVKTLADLFAPISGEVIRVNTDLEDAPELINKDCYGKGWLIVVRAASPDALESLLDAAAYEKLLASS